MPSKKAPPTLTPEQIAAKRAAAMAMFGGGAPAAGGKAPAKPKPSSGDGEGGAPTPPPPTPDSAAIAGMKWDSAAPASGAKDRSDWIDDDDGDATSAAAKYVASTLTDGTGTGHATKLPSVGAGWERMVVIDTTAELYKKAKKEGTLETVEGGRIYNRKGVAFLTDAEGREHLLTWRTDLKGATLGTAEQPYVRAVGAKLALLDRSDEGKRMLKAIATHTGATLLALPTGHVTVDGTEEQADAARSLVDDLVDGTGNAAREKLGALLVVAAPWSGSLEVPCPQEWAGAVIGRHGAGIKAIASETGCIIEYIEPEEEEEEGGTEGGGAEGGGAEAKSKGHFVCKHKFESGCRVAVKRIEDRLTLLQRLDVSGYVMVPRGCVGRLIGSKGANIKLLQRASGASRLSFDKEPGGRSVTQACTVQASDLEACVTAARVVLEAVPDPNASLEHKAEYQRRLEAWGQIVAVLRGGERDAPPVADATREMALQAHRDKYGTAPPPSENQTKANPAELASFDFDTWVWQWAVCTPLRA